MRGRGDSSAEAITNQISDSSLSTNNVNRDKKKEEDPLHIVQLLTYLRPGGNYAITSTSWHDSTLHKIPQGEKLSCLFVGIEKRFEDGYDTEGKEGPCFGAVEVEGDCIFEEYKVGKVN